MARQQTRSKVHEAVLSLARETPIGTLTMEGVAKQAGVSKQTLYRTWPSTGAILFDALLARGADEHGIVTLPNSGSLGADLLSLATATIAELTDPTQEPLLRAITAEVLSDERLAAQYRELLLAPQLTVIANRFRQADVPNPDDLAEMFLGPIFHRWLLRSRPFDPDWVMAHVARTLRVASSE